jgi:hypothetical protein
MSTLQIPETCSCGCGNPADATWHGTTGGHANWRCRCDACRKAKSDYDRARRNGAASRPTKLYRPHGYWDTVLLPRAAEIVESYDTPVTLRQLFYRLVSIEELANTKAEYDQLSTRTTEARRADEFPALMDAGRAIVQSASWASPESALRALAKQYRRDRTEGQEHLVYLGMEKAGLVEQVSEWFGDLGLPILATRGYHSQSFETEILQHSHVDGRPTVLLYAGDLDPEGEDIERNLRRWTDFAKRSSAPWSKAWRLPAEATREPGSPAGSTRPASVKSTRGSGRTGSRTRSLRPGGVKRGPGSCVPASGTGTRRPPGSYWSDVSRATVRAPCPAGRRSLGRSARRTPSTRRRPPRGRPRGR